MSIQRSGPKLTGYEWYRSIGSPSKIVAPMVDQSDLAFRLLCRKWGADLAYTQMLNAPIFVQNKIYRWDNLQSIPAEKPVIVQIAGHTPQEMLECAKIIQASVDCAAIDVNLGCPQGIAKRGRYGAYLMEELDLLTEIVSTLANGLEVPVTCKTRIYKGENALERSIRLCETLVNAGASLLTIHGRTRDEKGEWTGAPDWEMIRRIKEHFKDRVPVIANGGIENMDDVEKCLAVTGCDGVMTSEGILENPAIFNRTRDENGNLLCQIDIAREYLQLAREYPCRHIKCPRAHIMKILYRYLQKYTDLRDLATGAQTLQDLEHICDVTRERVDAATDFELFGQRGLTWYTRHANDNHSCAGRVKAIEQKEMMAIRDQKVAEKAWQCFEKDGEGEGEDFMGIFASLGMGSED